MLIIERKRGKAALAASLKPFKRVRQGEDRWFARGFAPVWNDAQKCLVAGRVERRLFGDSQAARKAEIDAINRALDETARLAVEAHEAEKQHAREPITFQKAYTNYIETNGAVPIYWEKLLTLLGSRSCHAINDSMMVEAKRAIFKPDAAASYVNRHLYTPVIAILAMALGNEAPKLTRPRGHKDRAEGTEIRIPPPEWYGAVTRHLAPGDAALVYFLVAHGRRLADAQRRHPSQFDPVAGTLTVGKTKNGDPLFVNVVREVADMIRALPRDGQYLFGDGNPSRFRARVAAACAKAGAEYYTPHEFGRHSFATRMLRGGYSLQFVRDAGGWKSIEIVSRLYGHLERKEWQAGVERVAADLFSKDAGAIAGTPIRSLPTMTLDLKAISDK